MSGFKSAVTIKINTYRHSPGMPVWQRNYWEHIIRDVASYHNIILYIQTNPTQWENDQFYTASWLVN